MLDYMRVINLLLFLIIIINVHLWTHSYFLRESDASGHGFTFSLKMYKFHSGNYYKFIPEMAALVDVITK